MNQILKTKLNIQSQILDTPNDNHSTSNPTPLPKATQISPKNLAKNPSKNSVQNLVKNFTKNPSQNQKNKSNKIYQFQFIFSSCIACCFLVAFFIRIFKLNENEKISENLMSQYHVSTLYANSIDHSVKPLSTSTSNNPFVIGMIKIDKINLNYPILSQSSKELLNISLCRFAGPMPNQSGNLCIAGHNLVDYKLFSRLHELNKKDTIKIYDLNGTMIEYSIIKKYEVSPNDISCTSQNTNGETILTLLTCNNVSGKRLVVVAKPL